MRSMAKSRSVQRSLLGIDRLVEGYEVFGEFGKIPEVFEADDGEGRGGEAVFAGILSAER